jgi:uncharacterized FlaG/YvyC family protein
LPAGAETTATTPADSRSSTTAAQTPRNRSGLGPAIAKLFGTKSPPDPIRLDVSYRVLSKPDVIVTVFSDPQTGQEVAQFPPEILIGLAEFFDQQSGVTLDKDA